MIPGGRVGPQWEREIFTFSKPNRSEKLKRVWNDPQVVLTEGCSNHDTWSRAEPSNGVGFLHSNTRIKQSLMVLDTSLSYTLMTLRQNMTFSPSFRLMWHNGCTGIIIELYIH